MKINTKISTLAVATTAIVVLWLLPQINHAKEETYNRFYENTDLLSQENHESDSAKEKKTQNKKAYKREQLKTKRGAKDVSLKVFSRSVQFLPEDSIAVVEVKQDSATASSKIAK